MPLVSPPANTHATTGFTSRPVGFSAFVSEMRPRMELPITDTASLATELAARWQALSADERARFAAVDEKNAAILALADFTTANAHKDTVAAKGAGGSDDSTSVQPVRSQSPAAPLASFNFYDPLKLENLRSVLIRLEESIIFALIERAQFKLNAAIYDARAMPQFNGLSFLKFFLYETEILHAKVRRYTSPDEHPYCAASLLPAPILPQLEYPVTLKANDINVNDRIAKWYESEVLPSICAAGDDQNYGSAATADITCLTGDHMVLTRSGWRSITLMRVGDVVMSFNVKTYAMEWKAVTKVVSHARNPCKADDALYRMQGSGMDIIATRDHRMLLARLRNGGLQTQQPVGYETVGELLKLTYPTAHKSKNTRFEHNKCRAVVCAGLNRQPAIKIVIPGLARVCDWWWAKDQQVGFLHFLGFWLGDGHLHTQCGKVVISPRKLEPTAWLIELLNDVFPRWWYRYVSANDRNGTTYQYFIRCPPLYNYLRVMAVGPLGYNPRDSSELRSYPHFTFDDGLAEKEQQSPYYQDRGAGRWTEDEMLAAMNSAVYCWRCSRIFSAEGIEMLQCSTTGCNSGGHLLCFGLTARPDGDWFCPECDADKPLCCVCNCIDMGDEDDELLPRRDDEQASRDEEMQAIDADTVDDADDEDDKGKFNIVGDEETLQAMQEAGAIVWWNGGLWIIVNGHWFYLKRWLGGDNVDKVFSQLSREQAVALLDGFCRADGKYALVQYDQETGEPAGQWRCSTSSFPLIDHLMLIAQLAGASVYLKLHTEADKATRMDGRTVRFSVDRWQLLFTFTQSVRNIAMQTAPFARPVDVSGDINARGYYQYKDDCKVYCIKVDGDDTDNFLTQRLSIERLQSGGMGVRAHPIFVGNCLQLLSKRIHYGKFVAESKFRSEPEAFTRAILTKDMGELMALITKPVVEEQVIQRVHLKAATYGGEPVPTPQSSPALKGLPNQSHMQHSTSFNSLTLNDQSSQPQSTLQPPSSSGSANGSSSGGSWSVAQPVDVKLGSNSNAAKYKISPDVIANIYLSIIALNKEVQIEYLLKRLD